ncbi:tripartite tricarboxylate transporter substrate-binding protein [Cupriavidus basilensis]|uniref:tripartite tricarboxylate transporter substrate-binding protein n=1 Tax=Cupriavidus basilensis TaxID=68895 RepID=UPI0039F6B143
MLCPDFMKSIYPFVFRKLNYEPEKDIRPVSTVAEFPMALAVRASSPAKTFAEYAACARIRRRRISATPPRRPNSLPRLANWQDHRSGRRLKTSHFKVPHR